MFNKMTLNDYEWEGKKVLLRVDYNVPLNSNLKITNDRRIRESIPTIKYLVEHKARVIICTHLGRPEGKVLPEFGLEPVAERLRELIKMPVILTNDVADTDTFKFVRNMKDGDIIMMQNLRFEPGEESNDPDFVRRLSSLADIYCGDAFGTLHREHASTVGVAKVMPSCVGLLVEKEMRTFDKVLNNPDKPFVVLVGGSKVKDKIELIDNLLDKADTILVGGAMAYTFLRAQGYTLGKSLVEKDKIPMAKLILEKAEKLGTRFLLPVDHVAAAEFSFAAEPQVVTTDRFPRNLMGLDIGPKTLALYKRFLQRAKTVFWNGPMGVFEFQKFAKGTNEVAKAMAKSPYMTMVGGGDSIAAVEGLELQDKIKFISTGGGASLRLLEGKSLPGIEAIQDKFE